MTDYQELKFSLKQSNNSFRHLGKATDTALPELEQNEEEYNLKHFKFWPSSQIVRGWPEVGRGGEEREPAADRIQATILSILADKLWKGNSRMILLMRDVSPAGRLTGRGRYGGQERVMR
ncbi:hypothetical protein RRG08_001962 [Elysia crispata]|uniref:Uncharacterized protein n=1 Tax=Elysia crispata TaxID=231223 RepID=A0AAE1BAY6_9GAST|nr:hypothetical protein RRG08_001962 [Elysia crispata]